MGQAISSTQFFLYGKKHFTQTGYLKHVKQYYAENSYQTAAAIPVGHPSADQMDARGKVVVVTGANSGLGKEVATYAAAKGARVYMLCRSQERADKAREEILEAIRSYKVESLPEDDNLRILLVDVSEMAQVRKVAQDLQSKESKIDALVCNAGVLLNDRRESSEGIESTFASHLLGGTYLLGNLLVPQLTAAKGRCVIVTSGGMYNYKLPSWEVLTSAPNAGVDYDGTNVYAYAKRGQVLFAERYTRDVPEVQWVTVHPGWSDTPAVDEAFGDAKKYLKPLREPWQGAEGVGWLALTESANVTSGELYLDRKTQPKHLAGPFFTEGKHTKNTEAEVDTFMENLKKAAGM